MMAASASPARVTNRSVVRPIAMSGPGYKQTFRMRRGVLHPRRSVIPIAHLDREIIAPAVVAAVASQLRRQRA